MKTLILTEDSLKNVSAAAEINMTQIGFLTVGQRQSISNYRKGHNVSGGSNLFLVNLSALGIS